MDAQTVAKLLEDPEGFVRQIAEQVVTERQSEPADAEGLMSVKNAARLLDVPEDTIRKWIQRGQIKKYKVRGCVRVRVSELISVEE